MIIQLPFWPFVPIRPSGLPSIVTEIAPPLLVRTQNSLAADTVK
jgi:hypothetical protein